MGGGKQDTEEEEKRAKEGLAERLGGGDGEELGVGAGRTGFSKHGWSGLKSGRCPHPMADWVKEKAPSQGVRGWGEVKRISFQDLHMSNTLIHPIGRDPKCSSVGKS